MQSANPRASIEDDSVWQVRDSAREVAGLRLLLEPLAQGRSRES